MRVKISELRVGDNFKTIGTPSYNYRIISLKEYRALNIQTDKKLKHFPRKTHALAATFVSETGNFICGYVNKKIVVEKIERLSQPTVAESKNPPKKDALKRSNRKGALSKK